MTDNTPNQQPEKPAANTAQPIENKPTEPQKQPEKPTPTTQKQPEKTASQQPDSAPQQPIVIQQKASGGRGIATGALVLSLIALGASGFLFVQGQNVLKQQEMRIGQDLNKAALGNPRQTSRARRTVKQNPAKRKRHRANARRHPPRLRRAAQRARKLAGGRN